MVNEHHDIEGLLAKEAGQGEVGTHGRAKIRQTEDPHHIEPFDSMDQCHAGGFHFGAADTQDLRVRSERPDGIRQIGAMQIAGRFTGHDKNPRHLFNLGVPG